MSCGVAQPMAPENSAKRAAIVLFLILAPSSALADAIDGEWRSPGDARQFRIAGTSITSPAGTQTTGNYSRHAFSYVVPSGDPGGEHAIALGGDVERSQTGDRRGGFGRHGHLVALRA